MKKTILNTIVVYKKESKYHKYKLIENLYDVGDEHLLITEFVIKVKLLFFWVPIWKGTFNNEDDDGWNDNYYGTLFRKGTCIIDTLCENSDMVKENYNINRDGRL